MPLSEQSAISELTAMIGGAIILAIRELFPWLRRRWMKKRVGAIKDGWEGIHHMNQILTDTRRKTGARRGVVVKLTNGGGIPKPGSSVMSSIVYESDSDTTTSAFDRWQQQPVDPTYAEVISRVVRAGVAPVYLNVDDLPVCPLRTLLEADGIQGLSYHLLGIAAQNWSMYAAYGFGQKVLSETGKLLLTPSQTDHLRSGATHLREIVKRYNEVLL